MNVALITIYNPAGIGARYMAAAIRDAGHQVCLLHFKELRTHYVYNCDRERQEEAKKSGILFVTAYRPTYEIYSPHPTPVTDKEKQLLIEKLKQINPGFIGFSLNSVTYTLAARLTEFIRQHLPNVPIMWGGIHAIIKPEECIKHADIVCSGEGEEIVIELLNHWQDYRQGKRLDIPGLWFRYGEEIVSNPHHPIIKDLDTLPIPSAAENEVIIEDDEISEKMIERKPYAGSANQVSIFTARGCPYSCSYCVYSAPNFQNSRRYRRRSVDNVLREIEDRVKRLGMRHLVFPDEIFVMQKSWIKEFSQKFKQAFHNKYGVTFAGYVYPLTTSKEMVDWLYDAGMNAVGLGVQTGSGEIMTKVFHRPWVPDKLLEISCLISQYEWEYIQYDLISNNPFETEEHMQETLEFLLKCYPPFSLEVFRLVFYPACTMSHMEPPIKEHPEKMLRFWHMLYHLTGIKGIDRDLIRKWSNNQLLRENPEILEEATLVLYNLNNQSHALSWQVKVLQEQLNQARQPLELPAPLAQLKHLFPRPIRRRARSFLERFASPHSSS